MIKATPTYKVAATAAVLAAASIIATTEPAAAQQLSDLTTTTTAKDLISGWLTPTDAGAFAAVMRVMSTTLMLVASGLLAWHTLSAMMHAAERGDTKFAGFWGPVRIAAGVAFLAPVFGGYSAIHLLVGQIAEMGSGLADKAWRAAAVEMIQLEPTPPVVASIGPGLALEFTRAEMCAGFAKEEMSYTAQAVGSVMPTWLGEAIIRDGEHVSSSDADTWDYGSACGKVVLPRPDFDVADQQQLDKNFSADEYFRQRVEAVEVLRGAVTLNANLLGFLIATKYNYSGLDPDEWLEAREAAITELEAQIVAAGHAYDERMQREAEVLARRGFDADRRQKVLADAQQYGWVGMGLMWQDAQRFQRKMFLTIDTQPERVRAKPAAFGGDETLFVKEKLAVENEFALSQKLRDEPSAAARLDTAAGSKYVEENKKNRFTPGSIRHDESAESSSWLAPVYRLIAGPLRGVVVEARTHMQSADPIAGVVNVGLALFHGGAAIAGAATAGKVLSFVPGLGSLVGVLTSIALLVGAALLFFGGFLAIAIPLIAFAFVCIAVIGWMLLVLESLVAAVIWLVLMIRMDGDDFLAEAQRPGVLILLNMFLRPVLVVAGFASTFFLLAAAYRFLGFLAFRILDPNMVQPSLVGIATTLTTIAIVCYLYVSTTMRIMSLIVDLPDAVMRWFGTPSDGRDANDVRAVAMIASAQASRGGRGIAGHAGAAGEATGRAGIAVGKGVGKGAGLVGKGVGKGAGLVGKGASAAIGKMRGGGGE